MTEKTIKVLVVRDGRPGHEKQSLGIVAALTRRYGVEQREVRVEPGYKALCKSVSLLVGALPLDLAGFKPDFIIGAGSHTHFPILALQKRLGGRTIVCMSPMKVIRNRFDLCCIPRHDEMREGGNILLTDGPPGLNLDLGQHDATAALVLVGGVDEKSHVWDNHAIADKIAATLRKHPEFHWTLTTSPRTPSNFQEIFVQYQQGLQLDLCSFGQTSPGWLEKKLQAASWVLVTEDSLSMIFEALSAGCQVATIPVAFKAENKFVRCLQDLKDRRLICAELDSTDERRKNVFNEADRCVVYMQQQPWWPR
nr:ELM1/GtrOC1 family putative glycosyltransferase [uncultured Desulfobulbus sp.]